MASEKDLFQKALAFIYTDELEKAREILAQLLKLDRKNIDYWLWMSAVVKTIKERIYCLREVLALDPDNQEAALGLRMVGEKAPDLIPANRIPIQNIPWKTSLEIADEHPVTHKGTRSRVLGYSLLGVAIIGVFMFGVYLAFKPTQQTNTAPIKRWTLTPLPSAIPTNTPGPTSTGFAPISIPENSSITPTALYVATPHNRMEAYNAAIRAYEKGDWGNAVDYFKQVLIDEPNSVDVYYHLGDVYRFQGKYKEALTAYQAAIKINSNFAPAYLGKGRVLLENSPSQPDDALAAFQMALERDPKMYEVYLEMAKANLEINNPSAAIGWLEKFTQYTDNTATSSMYRAQAYLLLGENEKALSEIEKANQLDPTFFPAYKILGETQQTTGKYRESIPPLLTVLEKDPLDFESETLLARAYYKIGEVEKALTLISTVLQQDKKNIDAHLLRADIYLDTDEPDLAKDDFNAVIDIKYENFDANLGLGRVLIAQDYSGAAYNKFEAIKKTATTDSQKAILVYWRGKSLQNLNQVSAAIRDYNAALAYPAGVLPQNLRLDAEKQLVSLFTPTPTSKPTLTPKSTLTSTVTKTITITATLHASQTPTSQAVKTKTSTP